MEKQLNEVVKGKEYSYEIILVTEFPIELKVVCKEKGKTLSVKVSEEQIMRMLFSDPISLKELEAMISEVKNGTFSHADSNEVLQAVVSLVKGYIKAGSIDRIVNRQK